MPVFANAGELFRYRLQTKNGREFEYVFESSADPSSRSITREEATRIAADWMTTFYHLQFGSIEYAEFREKPLPHWLVCFADTAIGPRVNTCFSPWCWRTEELFSRRCQKGSKSKTSATEAAFPVAFGKMISFGDRAGIDTSEGEADALFKGYPGSG